MTRRLYLCCVSAARGLKLTDMSLLSFAKKIAGRKPAVRKNLPKKEAAAAAAGVVYTGALGLVPLITEDSVVFHGDQQTVAFRVRPAATKRAIAAAVKGRFGTDPVSVRILRVRGKARRRGQTSGASPSWKKAYVTLPAGKTIDVTG